MEYTTQMDAARKGIFTPEMAKVAEKEHLEPKKLMVLMAEGKVIIPCNKVHTCIEPNGLGSMLKTKINVNLGTSRDLTDLNMELEKVNHAVEMGAEAIMDLSSFGDTQKFRRKLTHECPAMIGTVPIYDAVVYYHKALGKITAREWIDIVRMHAEDGVDFMTIHCGINKETAKKFKRNRRLMNIVSRGGSIIFAWMEMTGEENPFFQYFDEILDICREYDVTLSLGDACRPGCLQDATDASQIEELITLGELTKRAWEKDVQIMIEGPGHMPLNQIAANMETHTGVKVQTCTLDITFYRDDLTKRHGLPTVNTQTLPVDLNDKEVILVDDVLFTGRTVRAAIDAVFRFGRPARIRLVVLVDRGHRELPIRPDFVGKNIPTSLREIIAVHLEAVDGKTNVEIYEQDENEPEIYGQ